MEVHSRHFGALGPLLKARPRWSAMKIGGIAAAIWAVAVGGWAALAMLIAILDAGAR